jgi:hypothetical protein
MMGTVEITRPISCACALILKKTAKRPKAGIHLFIHFSLIGVCIYLNGTAHRAVDGGLF